MLLLVFGAVVAAGVPLLLALSAVAATIGLVALPSHIVPMDPNVSAVVLLVGLAVGVDYALFYLKREREERASGKSSRAALEAAAATSGRSVLISGATVMIAMAGMLFTGDKGYMAIGVATMLVVGVAMLGSLTVLPALLSRLGDKIERGKIPFLHRLRRNHASESRFWGAILTPALKHPAVSAIAATAVLLVMAVPVLQLHTAQSGLESLPNSLPTVSTIKKVQESFPGNVDPALVAIKADADSPATAKAVAELKRAGARERPDARADHGRRQPGAHDAPRRDPARGQGHRRRLQRRARDAPQRGPPGDDRAGSGSDLRGHGRHGDLRRRERAAQALRPDRVRRSCSRSRSSCCCSRSARS